MLRTAHLFLWKMGLGFHCWDNDIQWMLWDDIPDDGGGGGGALASAAGVCWRENFI